MSLDGSKVFNADSKFAGGNYLAGRICLSLDLDDNVPLLTMGAIHTV